MHATYAAGRLSATLRPVGAPSGQFAAYTVIWQAGALCKDDSAAFGTRRKLAKAIPILRSREA